MFSGISFGPGGVGPNTDSNLAYTDLGGIGTPMYYTIRFAILAYFPLCSIYCITYMIHQHTKSVRVRMAHSSITRATFNCKLRKSVSL